MSKFNVHSHHLPAVPDDHLIFNCNWSEYDKLQQGQPFSLSVHPYDLDKYNRIAFSELISKLKENHSFWAIGECGLDKNIPFSPDFQISVLNEQYKFAQNFNKAMILHCVQSFDMLLAWKKNKSDVAMLIHGYVRKMPLMRDLINAGFYLSFGAAICQNRTSLLQTFAECPIDRLFLETDDQQEFDINEVYAAAAKIKNISVTELEAQILENKFRFFKKM